MKRGLSRKLGGGVSPSKPEQEKTVALNMAAGNQVIEADEGSVMTNVTVEKPNTLIAGNIKDGVNIGGVTGTLQSSAPNMYIEETYFQTSSGVMVTSAVLHGNFTGIRPFMYCCRAYFQKNVLGWGASQLTSISLPETITSIQGYAFSGQSALKEFPYLPKLTILGTECFAATGLTSFTINANTHIDKGAFENSALEEVTFLGKPSYIYHGEGLSTYRLVFEGCTKLTSIKVPWAEGEVNGAPWGATNATITYNYTV